jgi:hypothetical protein
MRAHACLLLADWPTWWLVALLRLLGCGKGRWRKKKKAHGGGWVLFFGNFRLRKAHARFFAP